MLSRGLSLVALLSLLFWSVATAQANNYRLMNKAREGQMFTVTDYLVKGKLNIIDFSSRACPSCQALEPKLAALASKNPTLVINQVDIDRPGQQGIDWLSPLARQYELRSVPYFKVYDPSGKLLVEGEMARKMVAKLLLEAGVI